MLRLGCYKSFINAILIKTESANAVPGKICNTAVPSLQYIKMMDIWIRKDIGIDSGCFFLPSLRDPCLAIAVHSIIMCLKEEFTQKVFSHY